MSDDEIIDEPGEEGELDESLLEDELGDELGDDIGDEALGDEELMGLGVDDDGLIATTSAATEQTETEVAPARKPSEDDDEEEEDLRNSDDMEADLSVILREKLSAAEEVPLEDDEEVQSTDDKTDGLERLQPRRPDENQCNRCFLLVRRTAPCCPVEDDACPLFP